MTIKYRCPGSTSYGRGGTARTVHGGCCSAFLLMSRERQERIGIRVHVPDPILSVEDDEDEPLTVGELIETVRLLQLADEDGVAAPVSRTPTVAVEADFPQDQLDALLQLGEPYGLQARIVRLSANSPA